jgi:alanyl-tRNA synthetase
LIRIVTIENTDWECCGGTHLKSTGQVGSIRIKRNERIADGVERLTYCGGLAAVEEGQRVRALIEKAAHVFSVAPDDLPKTAERFFSEWKERGKEIEKLREELARAALKGPSGGDEVKGVRIVTERSALALLDLTAQAKGLARQSKAVGVFVSTADAKGPKIIITSTADVEVDCREVLKAALAAVGGGSGGGKGDFAQGGAPPQADPDKLLAAARDAVRKALGG